MAGAGRGRRDENLVKITLSNGLPVLCAIFCGSTARLGQCVECGYFPEEVYFLFCRHALCEQCFQARKQYSCKVDKTVTKKGDAIHSSLYLPLQNIVLKCPCCCDPLLYIKIKEHIETSHIEWLEQQQHLLKREVPKANLSTSVSEESAACTRGKCVSQQAAPQSSFTRQREATPKQGEDKCQLHTTTVGYQGNGSYSRRSQACGRETIEDLDLEMLTDDDSWDTTSLGERDKEYGIKEKTSEEIVTCPHCITACAASEIEKHKKKCSSKEVKCHMCSEVITAKNYDEHMETHYRTELTRCKGAEVQEAVNDAPLSRWDAKKYVEEVLREKKEHSIGEPLMPEVETKTPVPAAPANPEELPHNEECTVAKPPRHDTTSHEVCRKHIELLQDEIRLLKEEKGTLEVSVQDLKEAVYNLQTIVQKLESSEEKNAKDMAKLEDEQRSASTHRIKLEELTQKHDSDTQNLQSSVEGLQTTVENLQATVQELLSSEEKNVKAMDSETSVQKLKVELRMDRISLLLFNHLDEGKSKLLELGSGVADGDWFKKPKRGASNPMFGFSGVIKLPDLENEEEGFLFHDCIVLKLTVHRRE